MNSDTSAISGATPTDKDMSDAWRAFLAATRRLRTRHAAEGLSISQMHLLSPLLESATGEPVGALAESADVASPTATRMLDGLERDGMIERLPSPEDRRRVVIVLTAQGREMMERERDRLDAGRRALFASLSDDERRQAHHVLLHLSELMEDI